STSKTPSYTKSVSWQHHRHSLQVFIALLRKITIRKEAGQDSLFHTSTNPQQVKAVCSNYS
ncbi:hypothetical protein, partial [Escherichia coli]|uniref:hypothetical protein n=1 Tax=Escherichia coli TaxID=562 RepID=UPI003CEC46D0